jgi:hypothetical protein
VYQGSEGDQIDNFKPAEINSLLRWELSLLINLQNSRKRSFHRSVCKHLVSRQHVKCKYIGIKQIEAVKNVFGANFGFGGDVERGACTELS